jgi:hypothetical protein
MEMDPLEISRDGRARFGSVARTEIEPDSATLVNGLGQEARTSASAHPGAAAALAFHHLVALLQQTLALAILAFLLLLDVGAFFIGHGILPARNSHMTMIEARVLVYKQHSRFEDFP